MALSASLSHVVLVITAAVLFYVALTDFKQFKIRNELIFVLAGLFVVHALLSGRWVSAHWNLAFAALMFCVMLYFYAQNLMGGGDVKILTVGFLWVGFGCAFPFAVLLAIFAAVHVVAAKFGWVAGPTSRRQEAHPVGTLGRGGPDPMLYLGLPAADIIGHPAQPFALSHFTWQEPLADCILAVARRLHLWHRDRRASPEDSETCRHDSSWPCSCACHR